MAPSSTMAPRTCSMAPSKSATAGRFRGNVPASGVRRVSGGDAPRRRRGGARCGPQDPHDSPGHSSRPRRRATRAAGFPAAPHADATRITLNTGPTAARRSLDNLVLLCRRHHRAVHEGGFAIAQQPDGSATFFRPDGKPLEAAPAPPRWDRSSDVHGRDVPTPTPAPAAVHPLDPVTAHLAAAGITIGARTAAVWDGTPFELAWAIDVVRGSTGDVMACRRRPVHEGDRAAGTRPRRHGRGRRAGGAGVRRRL